VVALCVAIVAFAPVALLRWDVDSGVWPYIAVTSMLQLAYFALLATAYRHGEVTVVYPIARELAPVLVLVVGVTVLGTVAGAAQAAGVCLVGIGVLLVRGVAIAGNGRGTGAPRSASGSRRASRRTRSSTSTASSTPTPSSTSS
jgi:multidrug transporter EmrE-like cation transporter